MLTDRQRQVYDFISHYVEKHGYAPKLREIGEHFDISSRGTVHRHLKALEEDGLITMEPDRARGIRLQAETPEADNSKYTLPLLGKIAAGLPIEAIPGEDHIDLSEFFIRPNRFVLRVQGESMIDDGILDGDMVVVEHCKTARNGEIVVALIDREEATLKRIQHNEDNSITLHPANSSMQPLRYSADRVQIQGVVVGQFRAYR